MKSMKEANEFFESKGAQENMRSTYREAIPDTSYEEICGRLGMRPDIHFVLVTPAGISFTSGKPDEILLLLRRVREAGLTPAPSLLAKVEELSPGNSYL
jgi:hypothetical protein